MPVGRLFGLRSLQRKRRYYRWSREHCTRVLAFRGVARHRHTVECRFGRDRRLDGGFLLGPCQRRIRQPGFARGPDQDQESGGNSTPLLLGGLRYVWPRMRLVSNSNQRENMEGSLSRRNALKSLASASALGLS